MSNLKDLKILITRPQPQANALAKILEQAQAKPIVFPVLEIFDPIDSKPLQNITENLDHYDIAIFISPNAVQKSLNYILSHRNWPCNVKIAAIGKGSAKTLAQFNQPAEIYPEKKFNSEALLALDAMQDVQNKKIVIFRGDGGRELLGDTLQQRGAEVTYIEAYRRGIPHDIDTSNLMYTWSHDGIDIIITTSNESLRNLYDLLGKLGQIWLKKTPIVVASERGFELAQNLGCKDIIVIKEMSDEGILKTLLDYKKN